MRKWGMANECILYKRGRDTERIAVVTALVCGAVVAAMFTCCPQWLVSLFIAGEGEAARIAVEGFPYFSVAFVFFIINLAVIGYYQSVERVRPSVCFALARGLVFLVPSFMGLPLLLGAKGIWLALALSEILTTCCIVAYVLYGRMKSRVSVPGALR